MTILTRSSKLLQTLLQTDKSFTVSPLSVSLAIGGSSLCKAGVEGSIPFVSMRCQLRRNATSRDLAAFSRAA